MHDLKQELLRCGVAPELLTGWEENQRHYASPLPPGLLDQATGLIDLEPDAWAAVRDVYEKCVERGDYSRVLWQLHVLLLCGQDCPTLSTVMWETLRGYFGDDYPCLGAVLFISWIPGMKRLYESMGVSIDVMKATLSDLPIWMRDYRRKRGHWGVSEISWLVWHPAGRLFRLGRLQFAPGECPWNVRLYVNDRQSVILAGDGERYRADGQADGTNGVFDPEAWTAELTEDGDSVTGHPMLPDGSASHSTVTLDKREWSLACAQGMPVVEVHIPEDGKLDIAECGESFRVAADFIGQHFPGNRGVFQLCTWFLDPQLDGLLPPTANVVRFQRRFTLFPIPSDDGDCLDRVFGSRTIDPATAPADTSLRRAVLTNMAAGRRMCNGAGFLLFLNADRWDIEP